MAERTERIRTERIRAHTRAHMRTRARTRAECTAERMAERIRAHTRTHAHTREARTRAHTRAHMRTRAECTAERMAERILVCSTRGRQYSGPPCAPHLRHGAQAQHVVKQSKARGACGCDACVRERAQRTVALGAFEGATSTKGGARARVQSTPRKGTPPALRQGATLYKHTTY